MIASTQTNLDSRVSGVSLHTFPVETPSCGPLVRRYLLQVPSELGPKARVPVLIVLHDTGKSAEFLRLDARWHFADLAKREGLVLVYANAAPGADTDVAIGNSGGWQSDPRTHLEVDDEEYLQRILSDLVVRHVIDGDNDVYLAGMGGGARMALTAAAHQPGAYAGVAAFMPTRTEDIDPPRFVAPAHLSRVFLVLEAEGALADGPRTLARRWAAAFGISRSPRQQHWQLGTSSRRQASVEQLDLALPASGSAAVRVLVVDGPFDPFPPAFAGAPRALHPGEPPPRVLDGAWAFLSGADGAEPLPADLPEHRMLVDGVDVLAEDVDGSADPPLVFHDDIVKARPPRR
jgi:poly(3-hydroxybutyrate) depolymerase